MLEIPVNTQTSASIAAATLLVAACLIWIQLRRSDRRRLAWRIAATLVAVSSLGALGLRPAWRTAQATREVLLITPGASEALVREAVSAAPPGAPLLSLSAWWKRDPPLAAAVDGLSDLAELPQRFPAVETIRVVGHGLLADDWHRLGAARVVTHFAEPVEGVQGVAFRRQLPLGSVLRVQGRVVLAGGSEASVELHDPGGVVDSVAVDGDGGRFQLAAAPPVVGRHIYGLSVTTAAGTVLHQQRIAFEVTVPVPPSALIVLAAPSFEARFLKNWIGSRGGKVAVRTRTSRDRYRTEFLNTEPRPLDRLQRELLSEVDIVLADAETLRALPAEERAVLMEAVEEQGLGLFIFADESDFGGGRADEGGMSLNPFAAFRFYRYSNAEEVALEPSWGPQPMRFSLPQFVEPVAIEDAPRLVPLVYDRQGRVLTAAYRRGLGLVATGVLRQTYRWMLAGDTPQHHAYWEIVLAAVARGERREEHWRIAAVPPPTVDEPVLLTVTTPRAVPTAMVGREDDTLSFGEGRRSEQPGRGAPAVRLFLRQDPDISQRWSVRYWPRQPGWHWVSLSGGEPSWFYVHQRGAWPAWRAAVRVAETERVAAMASGAESGRAQLSAAGQLQPISLVVWYLLFLVSSGYLWAEGMLQRRRAPGEPAE